MNMKSVFKIHSLMNEINDSERFKLGQHVVIMFIGTLTTPT